MRGSSVGSCPANTSARGLTARIDHREHGEQRNREEAVYQDVKRPHQTWRKVAEQPRQLQAPEQDGDVLKSSTAVPRALVSQ